MMRSTSDTPRHFAADVVVRDLLALRDAGEDPRRTMRRLDARIVDCQRTGSDVPASLLQLSRLLVAACLQRPLTR